MAAEEPEPRSGAAGPEAAVEAQLFEIVELEEPLPVLEAVLVVEKALVVELVGLAPHITAALSM